MIHFILVDTALELIPSDLHQRNVVKRNVQKLGKSAKILDSSLHHTVMGKLENPDKRGRPDILHHFLLDTLGSPLNHHNHLKIHFHTPSGFFHVDSSMRCPRNYTRFKGLMVQLLQLGQIPPKPPHLIQVEKHRSLTKWLSANIPNENVLKLTSTGVPMDFKAFQERFQIENKNPADSTKSRDWAVIIGGFQKGTFSKSILDYPGTEISLGDRGYDSWTVVNRMLSFWEITLGLI
ncbi:MAG: hypothetical protein ACTSVZ_04870 [Promethearchaeota archaeon]